MKCKLLSLSLGVSFGPPGWTIYPSGAGKEEEEEENGRDEGRISSHCHPGELNLAGNGFRFCFCSLTKQDV